MQTDLPKQMNYKQALKFFNIGSYNTLYSFIKKGLKVTQIGGVRRIDQDDANESLEAHKTQAGSEGAE
ncbi:helix-turn-helix domain-containing protein [Lactiplantibacillus plantarum]|uniref:helix-turn-helix domain-containing protein n=1 Tax=Lactiplantibacillus plantarum TaxID=1590 RepID=UPI00217D984B|nr:helix-turn-helix domain-containing protein [Lactiplantibacillus plantarum]MCG0662337.1 prophage Lp3 protein 4 [Lactiplantibacillus plantarum]UWF32582.1 helix-turn-helix domain-containing protein [Lactiplantibacillus plantarum]UWF37978.1 helix-turn-helix domain-containing protein [Lactiplantibacillus plantarum]UWF40976.1 helix-turn-helix domain-containing protein [Lactiplantibacillus plantarum]WPB51002.1 helix-turn-helix domain-containing protein [Lactiplantibacillus plantarum]